jgi:predicted acetyltransferase
MRADASSSSVTTAPGRPRTEDLSRGRGPSPGGPPGIGPHGIGPHGIGPVEVGLAGEEDAEGYFSCLEAAFGAHLSRDERDPGLLGDQATVLARRGGEIVGCGALLPLELTLPGPVVTPIAYVDSIAVLPKERGRGVARAVVSRLFSEAREAGIGLLGLHSSVDGLYERWGFGLATTATSYRLEALRGRDSRRAGLRQEHRLGVAPVVGSETACRLVEPEEAERLFPDLFHQARLSIPGELMRPLLWWRLLLGKDRGERLSNQTRCASAAPRLTLAARAGNPVGYAVLECRGTGGAPGGRPRSSYGSDHFCHLELRELVSLDLGALASLAADLCSHYEALRAASGCEPLVELEHRPDPDPLSRVLAPPYALRALSRHSSLFLRLLEVGTALSARRYGCSGRLLLGVVDSSWPENTGRYSLEVDDAGVATVERLPRSGPADITLDACGLASVYLGGRLPSQLARGGREGPRTAGVVELADRLFRTGIAPFTTAG